MPDTSGAWLKSKAKGKGLDTCYCATYMSQIRDQQRFTISEVAANWHEPMVPQRIIGHPLPALTDKWTHNAASRHTIARISLHPVAVLLISRPDEGSRLCWPEHTVS